jgi:hypothetical protein
LAFAALLLARSAAANGRFPRSLRLVEDPRDSSHLILSATFGLLVTRNGGGVWHHVCEASFGVSDLIVDPLVTLTPDGTLLAGLYTSVTRASNDACDFQKTLGLNNRESVPDFALSASRPGGVVAALVSLPDTGAAITRLYRSNDGAKTWSKLGAAFDASVAFVVTVDVAPADDSRVYVSAVGQAGEGLLLRSDDGGVHFEELPLPTDATLGETPYIAAVDPSNPDALYVRTDLWAYDSTSGVAQARDALLYSADGGRSFSELMRAGAKLFGFAFSPDGTELMIGYGDPLELGGSRLVDQDALGIYRASKGSGEFRQLYTGSVGCLTWTDQGLYVCTHEADTAFTLGLARDTDFDADTPASFEPLLVLADVAGPLTCAACDSGAVCSRYWESTCQTFGRKDCTALPVSERCEAESGGASGVANVEGGTPAETATRALGGGCGCRLAGSESTQQGWALAALLLLVRRASRRGSAACRG